jgi:hypothetical protein
MWLLNRVVNPLVRAVLRSPFHFLLSRRLVVLRITGRRSGRTFELPVGYVREDDGLRIAVASPERKQWWRNIRGPTPVGIVLRGCTRDGVAVLAQTPASTHVRIALSPDPRPAAPPTG